MNSAISLRRLDIVKVLLVRDENVIREENVENVIRDENVENVRDENIRDENVENVIDENVRDENVREDNLVGGKNNEKNVDISVDYDTLDEAIRNEDKYVNAKLTPQA